MDRPKALPSRVLLVLALILGIAGCDERTPVAPGPTSLPTLPTGSPPPGVPSPPPVPPPLTVPPGTRHVPFPALAGPGEVYLGESYYGGALRTRYVLYEDGTFSYQHANEQEVSLHTGRYARVDMRIVISWGPESYGDCYRTTGTLSADVLTVPRAGPPPPSCDQEDWGAYEVSYYRAAP